MTVVVRQTDPNDDWARVELWRWQYGELPGPGDQMRQLYVPAGLRRMAAAIKNPDGAEFPTQANTAAVLVYLANLLEEPIKAGGRHGKAG